MFITLMYVQLMGNSFIFISFHFFHFIFFKRGKPKSYKLQYWRTTNEYQFNDDVRKYKSIQDIVLEYSKTEGKISLLECLPPSEYGM